MRSFRPRRQPPPGNAMVVTGLLKLTGFTNGRSYVHVANQGQTQMQPTMSWHPLGFGQCLEALFFALSRSTVITIRGDPEVADTGPAERRSKWLPTLLAGGPRRAQCPAHCCPTPSGSVSRGAAGGGARLRRAGPRARICQPCSAHRAGRDAASTGAAMISFKRGGIGQDTWLLHDGEPIH
jgi:hypothetical protein